MSAAKRQFLTSGILVIPESPELENLISNIKVHFRNLYYLLSTAEDLEAAKNLFVRRVGGGNAEFTLSAHRYSFPGIKGLQVYTDTIVDEACKLPNISSSRDDKRFNSATQVLQKAIDHLSAAMKTLKENNFPDYDHLHTDFVDAIALGKGSMPSMPSSTFSIVSHPLPFQNLL
jgi:hypothetical protein